MRLADVAGTISAEMTMHSKYSLSSTAGTRLFYMTRPCIFCTLLVVAETWALDVGTCLLEESLHRYHSNK